MAGNVRNGMALRQRGQQAGKGFVLRSLEDFAFKSFELDADGVVVAVLAAAPARFACVPCARSCIDLQRMN
jgi:hypothetical protein